MQFTHNYNVNGLLPLKYYESKLNGKVNYSEDFAKFVYTQSIQRPQND